VTKAITRTMGGTLLGPTMLGGLGCAKSSSLTSICHGLIWPSVFSVSSRETPRANCHFAMRQFNRDHIYPIAAAALVTAFSFLLSGCETSEPRSAKVYGHVRMSSEPLENGAISFELNGGAHGPSTGGDIVTGECLDPATEVPIIGTIGVGIRVWRRTDRVLHIDPSNPEFAVDESVHLVLAPSRI
jgi:hypothetical protein